MGEHLLSDKEQQNLLKLLGLSIAAKVVTDTTILNNLPGGVVTQEVIESFISQEIAKYGDVKLSKLDNALGAIPVFGFTAVTVHCIRRLAADFLQRKQLEQKNTKQTAVYAENQLPAH